MNINFAELLQKIKTIDGKMIAAWAAEIDRKTWLMIGGGLVAAAVFFVLIVNPAWFQRPALKKKVVEVEVQMMRLKALLPRGPELQKQKEEIQLFIAEFKKRLFREDEMAFLLGRISKLAQESQVEVLSSRPMEKSESFPAPYSDRYKKFIYLITVEGGYHQIAELVSKLESNAQYFKIQTLTIAPQAQTPGRQVADMKLMAVSHAGDQNETK